MASDVVLYILHRVGRLLHLLEVLAVRFQLVGRGRPGRIESLGGRAAREIWDGKITKASEVRTVLAELYISDEEFKQRFRTKTETDGKKARYILTVLERQSLLREGQTYADELGRVLINAQQCPLAGVKRTSKTRTVTSAFDPFRTCRDYNRRAENG